MWHISPVHGQPVPQIKPISQVGHPSEVCRDHKEALPPVKSILLGEDEELNCGHADAAPFHCLSGL